MAAIIYANTMFFEGNCSLDKLLGVVAQWLNDPRKTNGRFDAVTLKRNNTLSFAERQRVQLWASDDTFPQVYAIRYSHPDKDTSGRPIFGREWVTEIGFRREYNDSEIECTVLLRTEDDSPNSNVPEVSRPNLVLELIKSCPLISDVDGLSLTHLTILDENIMDGLRDFVIDSLERRRPLVVVSPTTLDEYLVKKEKLSDLLAGLASVIVIPTGFDTYKMEEIVGDRYAAYNGAVNIIFSSREVRGLRVVPTKKLMPDDLLAVPVDKRETMILAAVTRRTNSSSFSRHISPEMVSELQLRRRITKRREESAEQGAQSKELDDLWGEYEKLDREKSESDAKLAKSDDENVSLNLLLDQVQQEKDDGERRLKYETENKVNTSSLDVEATTNQDIQSHFMTDVVKLLGEKITLEDSLSIIEHSFPDRIVVLESARKSTKDAKKFRHQQKAFELLLRLATNFYEEKLQGKADIEAGRVFGADFSPREGEKTENNDRAIRERTFNYKGENIVMWKHLKHETKESDAETLRIHFHWDLKESKIVVGHCGKHLFVPK
jgi:hypothetical protein